MKRSAGPKHNAGAMECLAATGAGIYILTFFAYFLSSQKVRPDQPGQKIG